MVTGLIKTTASKIINALFRDLYTESTDFSSLRIGPAIAEHFDEDFAEHYFQNRRAGRKVFIADLEKSFQLESVNFCSIGCGYGGEESLLEDRVKKLVLIEPDIDTFSFLQKKFRSEIGKKKNLSPLQLRSVHYS